MSVLRKYKVGKRPTKRILAWIEGTKSVNRKLRKIGAAPKYQCWIRAGVFYEKRQAAA